MNITECTHTYSYITLLQHSAILWVNNGQLRTSLGDLSIKPLATHIGIIHVTAVTHQLYYHQQ